MRSLPAVNEDPRLTRGRWSDAVHGALQGWLDALGGAQGASGREGPAFAVFDADQTLWGGDLGEAALVEALERDAPFPELWRALPEVVVVPAQVGGGVVGRLFARARARQALEAFAGEGGAGGTSGAAARRLLLGTLLGLYRALEADPGPVRLDAERSIAADAWVDPALRSFFGGEVGRSLGARIVDGRPIFAGVEGEGEAEAEAEAQARGRVGAFGQIAVWTGLGRSREALAALAERTWGRFVGASTTIHAPFPVDAADAGEPRPIRLDDDALTAPWSRRQGVGHGVVTFTVGLEPRPEMVELCAALVGRGVTPLVVSASHEVLVATICERRFGIAAAQVRGVRHEGGLLVGPMTGRGGKVEAFRGLVAGRGAPAGVRPLLCAGDSVGDLELLAGAADLRLIFDRGQPALQALVRAAAAAGDRRSLLQAPFEGASGGA